MPTVKKCANPIEVLNKKTHETTQICSLNGYKNPINQQPIPNIPIPNHRVSGLILEKNGEALVLYKKIAK